MIGMAQSAMSEEERDELGWHVIAGTHLLEIMRRAHKGENPDWLFAELWANSEHHPPEDNDD